MISIDVNTGKNTGSCNLEKTVFETNMEAAEEIPRQLRLRNLGGIIILDFIDMTLDKDKKMVIEELEKHLAKDRIKNNIVHFTELGLVEMTRKRVGKQLWTYFMDECTVCNGTGLVKSIEAIIHDIIKEIKFLSQEKDIKSITLKVNTLVYDKINNVYKDFIKSYLEENKKTFSIHKEKTFDREKVEIVLGK